MKERSYQDMAAGYNKAVTGTGLADGETDPRILHLRARWQRSEEAAGVHVAANRELRALSRIDPRSCSL
jgi:hypothetical protein